MSGSVGAHTGRRRRKIPYKEDHGSNAAAPNSNINVTPLVDVCLVLLIIFMVVTPMLGRGKDIKLPVLVEAEQHKEGDQVFVSVDQNGFVFINQDQYTSKGDFQDALRKEVAIATGKATASKQEGPVLFVKGDRDLEYKQVRWVMEWVEGSGVSDIALVVDVGD